MTSASDARVFGRDGLTHDDASRPLIRGSVPLHRQLSQLLHEAIVGERMRVGDSLLTERELAARYSVSRITVRHALRDLELAGLVRRNRPTGNVVASKRARPANAWSFESLQDVVSFGEQTKVRILSFALRRAPVDISTIFGTANAGKLACVHGLRLLEKQPLSEFFFWLPPNVASQLTRADLLQPTLFSVIETRLDIRLVEAQQTVWCESAGQRLAKLLQTRASAPVLAIRRLYIAEGGLPVEVAVSRFAGSRYRLQHVLTRLTPGSMSAL